MRGEPAAGSPARMTLRKKLERALRAGHPWIFRDALEEGLSPKDGAIVVVTTRDGLPIGRGFWSATTPIAVRMLTTDAKDDLATLVPNRLAAALRRRLAFIDRARTDAFRWVHGEADLLPGLHLDVYAGFAVARFDGAGARAFYRELPSLAVAAAEPIGLHTVIARADRRSQIDGSASGRSLAHAKDHTSRGQRAVPDGRATALCGQIPPGEIEVRENGLRFGVDLARGQKGGLFLDQRDNRQRVRDLSRDRRVLNLFGYTGGFSVHAAAGGARQIATVDIAGPALLAARRNFERNGLRARPSDFVVADAFAFLTRAGKAKARWDLVVCDPPSFAPNRRSVPEALRAYRRLHRLCAAVVMPGGLLCAASCSSHVNEEAFVATIEEGCLDAGRRFTLGERHGAGADHPVLPGFPEGRYLKFIIGTVA